MGYIFQPGKFNNNTWLIDAAMKNAEGNRVHNGFAAYLIKTDDGANCLINAGARTGAESIYKKLKRLGAWPLQRLILTHSHWDHTQGVIFFREKVEEDGIAPIEIFASEKAIPYLKDQSYNTCFVVNDYISELINIEGVKPLKDKEKIYINKQLSLEIINTPGHMPDHIAVYDKKNKTAFVGDTPGIHWFTDLYVCNSNSPFWSEKDYLESIEKLKSLDLDFLCIAHFGVLTEGDIIRLLDNSVSMYFKWMELFDQNENKLDDPKSLLDLMWDTLYQDFANMSGLKENLHNDLLHAINYYKVLKGIGKN